MTSQTETIPQRATGCGTCISCNTGELARMGLHVANTDFVVALAGNPNTGKSTVFNALTGLRQHVGNWPGKTVVRAEGAYRFGEKRYKVVDLPGTYSLQANSADEEVARDFLLFAQPDVTVVVTDATCLERNLNLVLQVIEITSRVVVAVNLMDEAKRLGIDVDVRSLARELGVPVVPMAARKGEGIRELLAAIQEVALGSLATKPRRARVQLPAPVENAVSELAKEILQVFPELPNARWVALRLLDGDASVETAIRQGRLGGVTASAPLGATSIPLEAVR